MELKIKQKTTLGDLPNGSLFLSEDKETLGLKSEYKTLGNAIEAHIVGSGEMFWGGTHSNFEQQRLIVWEVELNKNN
jgi:hypothetical protein